MYRVRAKKGYPAYRERNLEIRSTRSSLLVLSGDGVELTREGRIRTPQARLDQVDHLQVSRGVHKIALEYELLELIRRADIETARKVAHEPPLSTIAEYVRRGIRQTYRPYGVQPQGATGVSIVPVIFEGDSEGILVTPAFTGYIVGLPGARFSCTLADDSSLLQYMLSRIEKTEAQGYLTTRIVYWTPESAGVITTGNAN